MAYSNGYDMTAVMNALTPRLGWRQPTGSDVPTLTDAVKESKSGRFFQDFHALCTPQNIKSVMEQAGAGNADLCAFLDNQEKGAIASALNSVFTHEVIEQVLLFSRYGQNDVAETASGKFVGYEINVADREDRTVQIDSLRLYFDGAATFNVYLFKDGVVDPHKTKEVTTTANALTDVVVEDWILTRGRWYVGYFQSDASANAIREQVQSWATTYNFSAQFIQSDATGAASFNREEKHYTFQPLGLNLEISSFRDHTKQIVKRAGQFDELIGLHVAYAVLEQIIYSTRSNAKERVLKESVDTLALQLDLNGSAPISDGPKTTGLKQRIEREVKKVREAFYPKPKSVTVSQC